MALPDMTTNQFLLAAQKVMEREPRATLVKNQAGNLSVMDIHGDMVGWVDLVHGEVHWLSDLYEKDHDQ